MEFVNKTTEGRRWSHPILKRFLDRCREKTPYPENLYDEMKDDIEPDHTLNPAQKSTYRLLLEGILNEYQTEVILCPKERDYVVIACEG